MYIYNYIYRNISCACMCTIFRYMQSIELFFESLYMCLYNSDMIYNMRQIYDRHLQIIDTYHLIESYIYIYISYVLSLLSSVMLLPYVLSYTYSIHDYIVLWDLVADPTISDRPLVAKHRHSPLWSRQSGDWAKKRRHGFILDNKHSYHYVYTYTYTYI